ncbi:MAG: aldo/keto reductase [Anaerolineae bacterium]
MRFKKFHDGYPVPVLGLGTSRFGADLSEKAQDVAAIRKAIELGYTHIDTAEVYGGGESERVIGEAIKGFDRKKLFITSKVGRNHLRYAQVLEAIEGSLERLGTDYLDLYLIHAPDPTVPLDETFRALNELVEQGKTRYIGVSNFNREQMDHAFHLTESILATNQVHYNLMVREPEENGVLTYCQQHDVLLTAYSPVKRLDGVALEEAARIARGYSATPHQVALAWLISKPHVITIVQSTDEGHMRENLDALDLELSAEEIRRLDALHEVVTAGR